MRCKFYIAPVAALLLTAVASCTGSKEETRGDDEVLVQVGDSALTLDEVLARIPAALSPEDSTEMFHSIVDTWVRRMVLEDFAAKNVSDMDRVEEMVEQYRSDLIIRRYLQSMEEKGETTVTDDRVKEYFESHSAEMNLESPIVKGGFIKVPENDNRLPKLRKWMAKGDEASIDNLEKYGLDHALQYEEFSGRWIDWSLVADQIPYRFGDADAFLASHRDFEVAENGTVYLLHIAQHRPSGSRMPYEYAAEKIRDILLHEDMNAFRANIISDIYKREMKEGMLRPGLYDPLTGNMKETKKK